MDSNGHLVGTESTTSDIAGLLPVQYHGTVRPSSAPELRLMAAVLCRAISDFRRYSYARQAVGRELFRLASQWIASVDVGWPYSYENICRTFDIDARDLRRALVRERTLRQSARSSRREPQTVVLERRCGSTSAIWEPLASGCDANARRSRVA